VQKTPSPRRSRAFVFIPILLILTIWSYYGFAIVSLEFDISNFKLPESSLADEGHSFCSGPSADDASGASEGTPQSADFIDILSGNPAQSDEATKADRQTYLDSRDDIVVPGFGHLSFQCSAYLQN
jgi:hypothetical protein